MITEVKAFQVVSEGLVNKKNGWQNHLRCPLMLCPSNLMDGRVPCKGIYPPRLKLIQKLGLTAYQYKCMDCGNLLNVSVEVIDPDYWDKQLAKRNPAFIGGKPSYLFEKGA